MSEIAIWVLGKIKERVLPSVPFIGILLAGAWLLWIAELGRYRNDTGILRRIHGSLRRLRASSAKPCDRSDPAQ
ncbi:hypothetical protein [Kribbella sp. NPDC049227]|uniref:hypothetical protein n=1 Tax=Kribbella sp. NPDC049227 TaxID=3364113 RepID=UPI003714A9C9